MTQKINGLQISSQQLLWQKILETKKSTSWYNISISVGIGTYWLGDILMLVLVVQCDLITTVTGTTQSLK